MVAGTLGMFFLAVLYLQRVLGFGALETGAASSRSRCDRRAVAGLLRPAEPALRRACRVGAGDGARRAGARVADARAGRRRYAIDLLPAMLLLGIGAGVSFPALMTLAMSGANDQDAGLASGLVNTTMQVGGGSGSQCWRRWRRRARTRSRGGARAQALTGGYHLAFTVSAVLVAVGALVAATVLQRESRASEDAGEAVLQTS